MEAGRALENLGIAGSRRGSPMEIKPLKLPGTYEILLQPHRDERGHFMRAYDVDLFRNAGLVTEWVQDNEAYSSQKGVIRGLHFLLPPHAETKFVRVALGKVFDVFVDLRRSSESYGQWDAIELSSDNQKALYLPKGFAHGYCTLSEQSIILYKVDSRYVAKAEGGVRWNDPDLAIPWPIQHPIISTKDAAWGLLRHFVTPFE
jgi:dTDP-4-dehydrorhamnose 3,5-epimerase